MEDIELVKALGPYKIVEKTDFSFIIQFSRMHTNIYIYTVIWICIAIYLAISDVQLSALAVILIAAAYLAFCLLFRYIAIKNAFLVTAERGQVRLKYKNFFRGEREVLYDSHTLLGIQPSYCVTKQTAVASMRIHLTEGKEEELFFAGSDKSLALQRSEMIASIFAQVLGIKLFELVDYQKNITL
jgi:hypothetical protein